MNKSQNNTTRNSNLQASKSARNDDKTEELLKDLRTLIVMLKGTDDTYGLLDWVDSYYGDYRQEAADFLTEMENKYLNSKAETTEQTLQRDCRS